MIERNNFKPVASMGRIADRLEELVLLCDYDKRDDWVTARSIAELQERLVFPTTIINVNEYKVNCPETRINGCLNLSRFSAIVVHDTLARNLNDLRTIDAVLTTKIGQHTGSKIIIHDGRSANLGPILDYAGRNGFDRVITDIFETSTDHSSEADPRRLVFRRPSDDLATLITEEILAGLSARSRLVAPVFSNTQNRKHVLLLTGHDLGIDPRVDWIREKAPADLCIHQLAIRREDGADAPVVQTPAGSRLEALRRRSIESGDLNTVGRLCLNAAASAAAIQELALMERALAMSVLEFSTFFGLPPGNQRGNWHRWYLRHFISNALTLVDGAMRFRGLGAVIATDLDTLIPALIIKGLLNVPVFYDAHEYWAESDSEVYDGERVYWMNLEKRLVAHTDARTIVTTGLADILERSTGLPFDVLPNCEPLDREMPPRERHLSDGECRFLFQGGFVPGRGLDLLVDAWGSADPRATLHLRGPQSPYWHTIYARATATGLLGTRIFFPDAVAEHQLVAAAAEFDVGLIPYEPHGANYRNCCPNKLSQYMAAGVAILANRTLFVDEIVTRSGSGVVVDFSRQDRLVAAVNRMTADAAGLQRYGRNARVFFAENFHWEKVSFGFYETLSALARTPAASGLRIYETAIDGLAPPGEPYFLDRDPDGLG